MAGLKGQTLDHYQLLERIGQGGMATVYLATDTKNGREVAVKVLSPTISDDRRFIKRFRREANLVKNLQHPNIVPVLEYGEARGYVYTAMPFIEGETLHNRMARKPLTREENTKWMGQVAEALAFAHDHGVIHRDIKPSNVIISQDENALLMDFGLARVMEGHSSLTGSMLMGTPAYVSPEQGRGEKVDARSDQYSFGVILYEAATGRLPFDGETPLATVLQHLQEPVPRPRRFNQDLSPDVEMVILKSLAKKRKARFESVRALNEAYQAALAGRPIPKLEIPVTAPTRKISRVERQLVATPATIESRRGVPKWVLLVAAPLVVAAGYFVFTALNAGARPSPESPTPNMETTSGTGASLVPVVGTTSLETEAPLPTSTPPPTPITSATCPGISLVQLPASGNEAVWLLDNNSAQSATIQELLLEAWPAANGNLESVRLGSGVIWEGDMSLGDSPHFNEQADLTLPAGNPTQLTLRFHWPAGSRGYIFGVSLDAGCSLQGQW